MAGTRWNRPLDLMSHLGHFDIRRLDVRHLRHFHVWHFDVRYLSKGTVLLRFQVVLRCLELRDFDVRDLTKRYKGA